MKKALCYLKVFVQVCGWSLLCIGLPVILFIWFASLIQQVAEFLAPKLGMHDYTIGLFLTVGSLFFIGALTATYAIIEKYGCCEFKPILKVKAKRGKRK